MTTLPFSLHIDPAPAQFFFTVRGTPASKDHEGVRAAHNQVAGSDEGVAMACSFGDLSHAVYYPADYTTGAPREMLFIDYPAEKRRIVDYAAKWHAGSFEFRNTVRRFDFDEGDRPLLAQLEAIAGSCWRLFGLRGYARVDCRVDAAGRPWVLEVNINPCLSPDAGFAAAAARRGLDLAAVARRIIEETPARNVEPASGRQVATVADRGMAAIPQALP